MKKEITRLVIFFIIWIFLSIFLIQITFFNMESNIEEGTYLIPGDRYFDSFVIMAIYPLVLILIYFLISPLLALVFLKIHKILKFNKYNYAILKREEQKLSTTTLMWRIVITSLFTFSMASLIFLSFIKNPSTATRIIGINTSPEPTFLYIMILCMLLYPFILLILAPIWLMQDSCLMTSQKRFKEGSRGLPDIEGVHVIYQRFIYGYVGLSTIISFILLFTETLAKNPQDIPINIFAPFMLILLFSFPVALYDLLFKKSSKIFNKILSKKGILLVNTVAEI